MSLSKENKHLVARAVFPELNDVVSLDYVAPHLITKTMTGTPYETHGGWWWKEEGL